MSIVWYWISDEKQPEQFDMHSSRRERSLFRCFLNEFKIQRTMHDAGSLEIEIVPQEQQSEPETQTVERLEKIISNAYFTDIEFEFQSASNLNENRSRTRLGGHRIILALVSTEFKRLLKEEWKDQRKITISKHPSESFKRFFCFAYCKILGIPTQTIGSNASSPAFYKEVVSVFNRFGCSHMIEEYVEGPREMSLEERVEQLINDYQKGQHTSQQDRTSIVHALKSLLNVSTFLRIAKFAHESKNDELVKECAR